MSNDSPRKSPISCRRGLKKTRTLEVIRCRFASCFAALAFLSASVLFVTLSAAKGSLTLSPQEKEKKAPPLRWDPPQVDARLPLLSTPSCSLPDVLNQAGQRAQELVDHLQKVIAHEQVRYEQTGRLGATDSLGITGTQQIRLEQTEFSLSAKFDYVVDFTEKSEPLNIRESRQLLEATDKTHINAILDRGLPALALIFYPAIQGDYEMRCEGSAHWNNRLAWIVHFRQIKGKLPRTATLVTPNQVHPVGIKGRAWIAADSGQVMHLEADLVEGDLMIDLLEMAFSVDYAPVQFQSQDVEIWLPKFAIAYTDYAKRRMINEHTFTDFQLFTVQTQQATRLKASAGHDVDKSELGGQNSPSEVGLSKDRNADSREKKIPTAANTSSSESHVVHWSPSDVDENISPVEPGTLCHLEDVLQNAGQRIQELVSNLERFTATESLLQETINKSGKVSGSERRKYNYLISMKEIRPGILNVQEDLTSSSTFDDTPGGLITKGLPALVLIFHPYNTGTFAMKCEGLAVLDGQQAWQIYFRQRPDKPNTIRSYSMGKNAPAHPVALKGRAWFLADTYQILALQADLIDTIPEIQLTVDHTTVEYGPVHFSSRGIYMWLPQTAELYTEFKGKRIHQRMNYDDYLLFAVDDQQKVSSPKVTP
jgi:hypothetical protein